MLSIREVITECVSQNVIHEREVIGTQVARELSMLAVTMPQLWTGARHERAGPWCQLVPMSLASHPYTGHYQIGLYLPW